MNDGPSASFDGLNSLTVDIDIPPPPVVQQSSCPLIGDSTSVVSPKSKISERHWDK